MVNPFVIGSVVLTLIGGTVGTLAYVKTYEPREKKPKLEESTELVLPEDFLRPVPEQPTPPPPPDSTLSERAADYFNPSGEEYTHRVTINAQQDIKRKVIIRDSSRSSAVTSFTYDKKGNVTSDTVYYDDSHDKDIPFAAKTTATYPVDMTRVLAASKYIPAVLYNEIRSDIPSQKIKAVVEQNVYGFHGRKVLIPRGSEVIGAYESLKKAGDRRLRIEWYRVITPDGINIDLTAEVADAEGAAGMTGEIDHRWKDRYGTAAIFATINAGAQMSVPVQNVEQKAAADAYTQQLGQVTAEALREGLDIAPTVRIKKGTRIIISPLVDVWFKEPRQGKIEIQPLNENNTN